MRIFRAFFRIFVMIYVSIYSELEIIYHSSIFNGNAQWIQKSGNFTVIVTTKHSREKNYRYIFTTTARHSFILSLDKKQWHSSSTSSLNTSTSLQNRFFSQSRHAYSFFSCGDIFHESKYRCHRKTAWRFFQRLLNKKSSCNNNERKRKIGNKTINQVVHM